MPSQGPNFPAVAADFAGGAFTWSNPSNATADDGADATVLLLAGGISNYLSVSDFGFSVPADGVVVGLEVTVEREQTGASGDVRDYQLNYYADTVPFSNNKADTATAWPTGGVATKTYGGPTDLWGAAPTRADVNASSFTVYLQVKEYGGASPGTARVDYVSATVYYETYDPSGFPFPRVHQTASRPARMVPY